MKPTLTKKTAKELTGLKLIEFPHSQPTVILKYCDRPFVIVEDAQGHWLPFYMSTGRGGKKNVARGRWYPVVGMHARWINKSSEGLVKYYGSEKLEKIAKILDEKLICLKPSGNENRDFEYYVPGVEIDYFEDFIESLNMNSPCPCSIDDADIMIEKTVNEFLMSIGEKPFYSI